MPRGPKGEKRPADAIGNARLSRTVCGGDSVAARADGRGLTNRLRRGPRRPAEGP